MKSLLFAATAVLALLPASAQAYDWSVVVKVTSVEVSYMPTLIPFRIDSNAGTCAAGSPLTWNIRGADATEKAQNAQAVLAALMTSQVSDHTVMLLGNNTGCNVDFIYFN